VYPKDAEGAYGDERATANVISDISGLTGITIIQAILD
jgi:hypothetical protein